MGNIKQPTYDEVFSYDHLLECANDCLSGVGWKQSVQMFNISMNAQCAKLYNELADRTYKSKGFTSFYINERGKTRHIQSVHISERTVQKCLCRYALRPVIENSIIYDNSASVKGKGQDFAVKRFREHLRWHYARYGQEGRILIGDFHAYFDSIDHKILLEKLREILEDNDLYNITEYFIECFEGDKGIGLGSEISQTCAIFYLNELDHIIKDKFGIHCYARYMDDFYIISDDINKIKEIFAFIKEYIKNYGLTLNDKHTNIYKFKDHSPFSYLKNRTILENTGKISMRLTRNNVKSRRSLLRKYREMYDDGKIDLDYIKRGMVIWKNYAYKRKNSYKSVQSVMRYFHELFSEEIMLEREMFDLLKKMDKKITFLEKKVTKLEKSNEKLLNDKSNTNKKKEN